MKRLDIMPSLTYHHHTTSILPNHETTCMRSFWLMMSDRSVHAVSCHDMSTARGRYWGGEWGWDPHLVEEGVVHSLILFPATPKPLLAPYLLLRYYPSNPMRIGISEPNPFIYTLCGIPGHWTGGQDISKPTLPRRNHGWKLFTHWRSLLE